MSLDLYLKDNDDNTVADFNYTYNVSKMWHDALPGDEKMVQIEGMTGLDASLKLRLVIDKLESNPSHYKKMNPSNGWGDYNRFIDWLKEVETTSKNNPHLIWSACR